MYWPVKVNLARLKVQKVKTGYRAVFSMTHLSYWPSELSQLRMLSHDHLLLCHFFFASVLGNKNVLFFYVNLFLISSFYLSFVLEMFFLLIFQSWGCHLCPIPKSLSFLVDFSLAKISHSDLIKEDWDNWRHVLFLRIWGFV